MSHAEATTKILHQLLDEFGDRLHIHGGSNILVSPPEIAQALHTTLSSIRTPFGPHMTVTSQGTPDPSSIASLPHTVVQAADALPMDHFTHAVFAIHAEDPKFILAGLKHMIHAMQPKAYAIVVSIRQESVRAEGTVSLEDKLRYQSKGKVERLGDVLEFAGFERGRIRSLERTAVLQDGREVRAEVLLAMKWDQLTA